MMSVLVDIKGKNGHSKLALISDIFAGMSWISLPLDQTHRCLSLGIGNDLFCSIYND